MLSTAIMSQLALRRTIPIFRVVNRCVAWQPLLVKHLGNKVQLVFVQVLLIVQLYFNLFHQNKSSALLLSSRSFDMRETPILTSFLEQRFCPLQKPNVIK